MLANPLPTGRHRDDSAGARPSRIEMMVELMRDHSGLFRDFLLGLPNRGHRPQRSYRARLRSGAIVVRVEVTNEIIGLLIDLGWLPVDASEDRSAIAQAIRAVLENASR